VSVNCSVKSCYTWKRLTRDAARLITDGTELGRFDDLLIFGQVI
jgi:hypothetical protein